MSTTLEEVKHAIACEENAIRCAMSDADRDPAYVTRSHHRTLRELNRELDYHRDRRINGPQRIAAMQIRIAELGGNLEVLKHRDSIVKMLKLQAEINGLQGADDPDSPIRIVLDEAASVREHTIDSRSFIRAFETEINEIRRAMAGEFMEREEQLVAIIDQRKRQYRDFLDNLVRWPERVIAHRARLLELRVDEERVKKTGKVRELESLGAEIAALMAELGADKVAYVMGAN